jgi:hypothetical protein
VTLHDDAEELWATSQRLFKSAAAESGRWQRDALRKAGRRAMEAAQLTEDVAVGRRPNEADIAMTRSKS